MSQSKKSQPVFFGIGIIIAVITCTLLWLITFALIVNLRPLHENKLIQFQQGESLKQFSKNLYAIGLVPSPRYFEYWVILLREDHHLQTGYYRITRDMSLNALLDKMKRGDIEHFKLIIIPGETVENLFSQINQTGMALPSSTDMQHLEGVLYPNTYSYDDQNTLLDVLSESRNQMQTYLLNAWHSRDAQLPYQKPFDVLIMASLLEKESASFQDQKHIAAVFINRLHKGMYLDSDATVRYAVRANPGAKLVHSDFKSTNYFNTYRFKSLPPSPISFVSEQTIQAALHPLKSDDLYFLTNEQGQTIFSPTPIHLHLNPTSQKQ